MDLKLIVNEYNDLPGKLKEEKQSGEENHKEHHTGTLKQHSKGRWTKGEDNLLTTLVAKYGSITKLSEIETEFRGARNAKQIRERWANHLSPDVKKRKFNEEEIRILEEEFHKNKCKWAEIAKKLPGTSPLMVKNFYYNRFRKEVSSKKEEINLLTLATEASKRPKIDKKRGLDSEQVDSTEVSKRPKIDKKNSSYPLNCGITCDNLIVFDAHQHNYMHSAGHY